MSVELCALCGGEMEEQLVRVLHERGADGAPVIVDDVSASVCKRCGHRWFSLDVSRELERVYLGSMQPTAKQEVNVYTLK